jgi:hypothetical protein
VGLDEGCLSGSSCAYLVELARVLGANPDHIVYWLPQPSPGVSSGEYRGALLASLALVEAMEYMLFRGFRRLLQLMNLEDVMCLVEGPGEGIVADCGGSNGFSMYFTGAAEGAPSSLTIEAQAPAGDPSRVAVRVYASVAALSTEELDAKTAGRAARRVISYTRRTRLYRMLEDVLAETEGLYEVKLEPGDSVSDGVPEVDVEVYVAGLPGFVLPFDLNPILDLASYLSRRLSVEVERLTGGRRGRAGKR